MLKALRWPQIAVSRKLLLTTSIGLLATLFHLFVTGPRAQAYATAPKGWDRLHRVFDHPEDKAKAPVSADAVAQAGQGAETKPQALTTKVAGGALDAAAPDASAARGPEPTVADPALLHLLQQALRERRDAEYIYRLRHFQRQPTPIFCPPLPSYSLQDIELSDQERAVAYCHEQKQLLAQCELPASLFKPMQCPKGYQWRLEDDRIESERQWLAARTSKKAP